MKPIIGITIDHEEQGEYANFPYYIVRQNYVEAVTNAGGVPILLPYDISAIDRYIAMIDGLILIGGDVDIPPEDYGDVVSHPSVQLKSERTEFEKFLCQKALEQTVPLLAICAGEQLLNVLLGGTLIQHIADEVDNSLMHEQSTSPDQASHSIAITEGTLLHRITGTTQMDINSTHHQAVKTVGPDVVISAVAPDGVIEAIEYPNHPFCLGVEWHPEYTINPEEAAIFSALIDYASR